MLPAASTPGGGYATTWWPFTSMLVFLVAIGAVLWLVMVVWTTWVMHRPPRMTAGRALARLGRASPADVGLNEFEEERYAIQPAGGSRAGPIDLAAWWLPHPGGQAVHRTCVMLHGYGDSRAGSLAWAPLLRELGFHLLLPDLRAHGDSGGRLSGGGVWERDDLHALLDALRQRRPARCRQVVLFGISYGGMIAAACAAEREDLAALVLDSPVDGWSSATERYGELLGLPLPRAHGLRLRLAQWRLGVRFNDVRPAVTLPKVKCPTLAIMPTSDVLVSAAESEAIARAAEAQGELSGAWRVACSHNLALATHPAEYERRLREFLNAALAA